MRRKNSGACFHIIRLGPEANVHQLLLALSLGRMEFVSPSACQCCKKLFRGETTDNLLGETPGGLWRQLAHFILYHYCFGFHH